MGLEPIAQLAHRVEDLVDVARRDRARSAASGWICLLSATDTHARPGARQPVRGTRPRRAARSCSASCPTASRRPHRPAPRPTQRSRRQVRPRSPPAPPPGRAARRATALCRRASASGPHRSPRPRCPGARAFLVHKRLTASLGDHHLQPALEDLRAGSHPRREDLPGAGDRRRPRAGADRAGAGARGRARLRRGRWSRRTACQPHPPPRRRPAAEVRAHRARADRAAGRLPGRRPASSCWPPPGSARSARHFPEHARPVLDEGVDRLHALVKDLHDKVMGARMTPVAVITDRLPRAARDIARKRGKRRGADGHRRGDRARPRHPRRARRPAAAPAAQRIDHGIETPEERREPRASLPRGQLHVSVRRARDRVVVEIEDDGRGHGRREAQGLGRGARAAHRRGRRAAVRPRGPAAGLPARRLHREGRVRHLRPRRGHGRGEARGGERGRHAGDRVASAAAARASPCGCRSPWRW